VVEKMHFATKCPYAKRGYNDAKEESLSITMETKPVNEENEDNQKEKSNSKEEYLEAKLVSALEEIGKISKKNIK
jgi:hypothetical protein